MKLHYAAAAVKAVFKYNMPERKPPYKTYPVKITRTNANNQTVETRKHVRQYNGDKRYLFLFIRDSVPTFNKVVALAGWDAEEQFAEFYDNVLQGEAKNLWEEALEEGNSNGPIYPENPGPEDLDVAIGNFCCKVVDQEWPGNNNYKYLQQLTYEQVLETYGHTPTKYLSGRKLISKWTESIPTIAGTEPTEEAEKDIFYNSFREEDQDWFERVDNNGKHNRREMTQEQIADRMDARMLDRTKAAEAAIAKRNSRGGGGSGGSSGSKRKRDREDDGEEDNTGDADTKPDAKRHKDCYLHKDKDGNSYHEWAKCFANPDLSNKNFRESVCKKVLGWKDVETRFPGFVKKCDELRGLTVADGVSANRTSRNSRNKSNTEEKPQKEQQQQQSFQFNCPPMPVDLPEGTRLVLPTPTTPATNSYAPEKNSVSFAFGTPATQSCSGPIYGPKMSSGKRWVQNAKGEIYLA